MSKPSSVRRSPLVVVVLALVVGTLVLVGPGSTPRAEALPTCNPDGSSTGLCLNAATDDPDDWKQYLAPGSFTAPQVDAYNYGREHQYRYTPDFRYPVCPSTKTYELYGDDSPPPINEMPCSSPALVRSYTEAWVSPWEYFGGLARDCVQDCVLSLIPQRGVLAQAPAVTTGTWNEWTRKTNERGVEYTDWKRIMRDSEVTLPAAAPSTPPIPVLDITATGNKDEFRVTAERSRSTTEHALLVTTTYEFSDGTTIARQLPDAVTHKFTTPGPWTVKVTIMDARLTTATLTKPVADHLSVVGVLLGEASPEPNSTTSMVIAVRNDGIGPITNVRPAFAADPAERVKVTSGPTPASADLALGETQEFRYQVKTGSRGKVLLTGDATGTGSKGAVDVTAKEIEYEIGVADLQVTLEAPERVALKRDEAGELIPKDVDLKVHLKNLTTSTVRDISLRGTDPVQITDEGVAGLPFESRVTDPPAVRTVAELGPNAETTLTLPYTAVLAGGVDWLLRVDAKVGQAPDQTAIVRTAEARSEVGDEGVIRIKLTPQATPVRAGDDWVLYGTVKNITNDADVQLEWIRTKLFGNAAGAWVVDVKDPPAIGATRPDELKAGESWAFKAVIHTAVGMDALSAIELDPRGKVNRAGEDEVDLKAADIVYDGPKRISAQMITPTFDPSEQMDWQSVVGNFEYSALTTLWEGLVGLKELPRLIGDVSSNALAIYGTAQRLDYLTTQYQFLPKEARDEWIDETYASLEAQYGKGDAVLDGLKGQIATWFSDLRFAIDTGDLNQLARVGGSTAANVFDSEIFAVFTKLIRPKWGKFLVTKSDELEDAAKATAITDASVALGRMEDAATPALAEIAADDLRKGLVSGTPVTAASAKMWGVSQQTHDFLSKLAKQRGYLITLRARGIGALEKLQQGFLPKMELIKLKNVDPIDTQYLGYLADDLNTVVLKKPPVLDVKDVGGWVTANVADPAARAGVAERLTTRVEEWAKVQQGKPGYEYLKYADQKYMPVPFNVAENLSLPFNKAWNKRAVGFLKGIQDKLAGKAKFELAEMAGQPGYYRLKVNGRGITGDIDFMDFRKANGEPLSDLERLRLYRDLADGTRGGIVQLQHPETISWFLDSAQWFKAKKKYIEEFTGPRSDTLLQYSPEAGGSARAVRYDPARSTIEVQGGGNIWHYEGGFSSPARFRVGVSDLSFIGSVSSTIGGYLEDLWGPPSTWLVDPGQPGTGGGSKLRAPSYFSDDPDDLRVPVSYAFSTGATAVVARAGWDHLEYWTAAGGWAAAPDDGSAVLSLMPQSAASAAAKKGAATLPILAPDAATVGTATPAAWFATGQQVVINPGGVNEETRTLAGVSPLRFTTPLAHAHASGEVVSVIAAAPVVPPTQPTTPVTAPTTPNPAVDTTTTPIATATGPAVAGGTGADGAAGTATPTGDLARTGSEVVGLAPLGFALVAAGAFALAFRRRRAVQPS